VDEGKAGDVICKDFSKAFDTIPHDILLEKLPDYETNWFTLCWVMKSRAQSIVGNGATSSRWSLVVFSKDQF